MLLFADKFFDLPQWDSNWYYWYIVAPFMVTVFNSTFNNISVISWQSVLLVEETGVNHRPAASHCQTSSHNGLFMYFVVPGLVNRETSKPQTVSSRV